MDIPIFCFDEHNQAFYHWHRARIEGLFSRRMDLFHVDAHNDMVLPLPFSESLYSRNRTNIDSLEFYRRFASSQLTINDFILPAVLSGVVRNVYFVYPGWRKFKPSRKKQSIASAFGEGKVLKTGIKTDQKNSPRIHMAYPDLTHFQFISGEARHIPQNRRVILDIDLDYFACRDTITNQMNYELEITRNQFKQQDQFLREKTLPYSGMVITFSRRDNRYFARIEPKKVPDQVHFPSPDEIRQEIESLIRTLIEKKIRPVLVTVCRSCDSGYCPKEKADFIEPILMDKLKSLID